MQTKDFTSASYALALDKFWEFFNNNPKYILMKYERIKNGVRAYYTVNN